jgi:hypothetical protein
MEHLVKDIFCEASTPYIFNNLIEPDKVEGEHALTCSFEPIMTWVWDPEALRFGIRGYSSQ